MGNTRPPRASTTATRPAADAPVEDKLRWLHATYKTPPAEHLGKLPKPTRKDATKGNCNECGGFHGLPAVHLDYLGHAELTDILLDADPLWSWEPFALDEATQLPRVIANDRGSVLWIHLTIWGVTRPGVGTSDPKGPDTFKELIGDALRNAAMRFGIAVDLWSKAEGIDRRLEAGQVVEPDSDHDPNADPHPEDKPKSRPSGNRNKAAVPDVWTYDGLVALGLRTLNGMARERELPCTGKVEDYAMRLMDWQAKNATPRNTAADVPADTRDEDEPAAELPTEPPSGSQHPDDGTDPAAGDDTPDDEPDMVGGDDDWDAAKADPASVQSILDDVRQLKTAKARAYAAYKRENKLPKEPAEWTNGQLEGVIKFLDALDASVTA